MAATLLRALFVAALIVPGFAVVATAQPSPASPWVYEGSNPADKANRGPRKHATEIGTLRMMTPSSRRAVFQRINGDRVYDLSVQYFIGLPSWYGADDLPPIVARGVLIDVSALKNVPVLPDAYRITRGDLEAT